MNVAQWFIRRSVVTTVVMLGILLLGMMGYRLLRRIDLPNLDFPVIVVTAVFPGASPETMEASVATPLERQLSTIEGLDTMTSTSSVGNTRIILQFHSNRSGDLAAKDVQAAITRSLSQLPTAMPSPPSYRKVDPEDLPILYLLSPADRYVETFIAQWSSAPSRAARG
jgi:HAE1 family hydrophobic/amphiphilic exporter-1